MDHKDKRTMAVDGFYYENYLSPEARDNVNDVINEAQLRAMQGDIESQAILKDVQDVMDMREKQVLKEEQNFQRTLKNQEREEKRAGYINASIILYFVLLFGVLLASALIFLQK